MLAQTARSNNSMRQPAMSRGQSICLSVRKSREQRTKLLRSYRLLAESFQKLLTGLEVLKNARIVNSAGSEAHGRGKVLG